MRLRPANAGGVLVGVLLAAASLWLIGCGQAIYAPKNGVALKEGGELATWSPSGDLIAAPGWGKINLLRADGSVLREIHVRGVEAGKWPCECRLGWSGGSDRILFMTEKGSASGGASVGSVGVDGRSLREAALSVPAGNTAWSPDGWPLVFVANSGARKPFTPHRRPRPNLWRLDSLDGEPYKILSQPGIEIRPEFSPDGTKVLYVRSFKGERSVWVVNADGSEPHVVASGFWLAVAVWAPDSKRIAVAGASEEKGRDGVFVVSDSGSELRRLRGTGRVTIGIAWDPNGRWINYGDYEGRFWRIRPDGSGRKQIGSLPDHQIRRLVWSPTGRHLAYAAAKLDEYD